ncbi:NADPH-dependent FMN reductase [Halobacteriovorax sp. JY17]|uniref:NADPH-dependent FMN reductase n=1 Tax=Halobacteriovorax sp. JY17 TaxID=2014617 RepID=UPI000C46EE72|nr:NADPH-dependent FMN reductase [Halobacteriovorax sp. JY17]PIK16397.1 MAG: NADPH-dependent FMN reductase [Halobacteriovorax sp. JY17]
MGPTKQVEVVALNGSVRRNSSNGLLLKALNDLVELSIYESLDLLPHFNPDIDEPEVVIDFKDKVSAASYLLIVTPEYAHGVPGVLKNALDWLVSDERLPGKKVIVFVCSAGSGEYAMSSLLEVLKTMSLSVSLDKCFQVNAIRSKFMGNRLIDKDLKEVLENLAKKILSIS